MNKLLLDSTIDIYSQYDNNNNSDNNSNNIKIEETNNILYSDPSFYTSQANFQLPNSPDSFASNKNSISLSPSTALCSIDPPMLLSSSSTKTTSSTITDHSIDFINDIIKYNDDEPQRKKQRVINESSSTSIKLNQDNKKNELSNNLELRRQIHIQSEQKRRAQIKCGFEELRNELPTCLNKKMSKVALLHRTVQHIQHLKSSQMAILAELERLVQENEQLKIFQQSMIQKQTMDNMYSMQ